MSPNPAKAPWYFAGVQELLVAAAPAFAVLVVPLLVAVALAALPYVEYAEVPTGLWFHSRKAGPRLSPASPRLSSSPR